MHSYRKKNTTARSAMQGTWLAETKAAFRIPPVTRVTPKVYYTSRGIKMSIKAEQLIQELLNPRKQYPWSRFCCKERTRQKKITEKHHNMLKVICYDSNNNSGWRIERTRMNLLLDNSPSKCFLFQHSTHAQF
jgi:hypothetical protein